MRKITSLILPNPKRVVVGLILYMTCLATGFTQDSIPYKYALGIASDNDAYSIPRNFDRYYSFGMGLFFEVRPDRFMGLENLFAEKRGYFFRIGLESEGYTPTNKIVSPEEVAQDSIVFDRPFAGLLYGTLEGAYMFERSFIKAEVLLGIMGPSALTKEMQDWIHENITGDGTFDGWAYQVPDQLILNLSLSGVYNFLPDNRIFDVFAMGRARVGNLHIDAAPGLGLRLGKFGPLGRSSAFGNNLMASITQKEIFLKSTVSAHFTAFNGTAQGNLFKNDFEYAIEDLSRFHIEMTHGIFISGKRYALGYNHFFNYGKVVKDSRHVYGRFEFMYRF